MTEIETDVGEGRKPVSARIKGAGLIVLLLVLAGAAAWYWHYHTKARFLQDTNDATIQADQVAIAAKLPGYVRACLLYTSPSPRDRQKSRMPSSA